ncbi:hypothetical protein CPB86DRAFT_786321 [Serendipita vermifera]|nr:hypothetical protein CPB86DRAFT_786321 [Serendipita vermifera]
MMLSALFTLFGIAALQAYGLLVPRQGGQADDVPFLSCESAGVLRPLYLKSTPLAVDPLLPSRGIPVDLVEDILSKSTTPGNFAFQLCNSSLLGLSSLPGDAVQYGHVLVYGDDSKCLSIPHGSVVSQDITTQRCNLGDDSIQLLQFWKLTTDSFGCTTLDFVGRAPKWGINGYYDMLTSAEEGSYRPQLQYLSDATDPETPYQLGFA